MTEARETRVLELTEDELLIINGCLNEVCNGLDIEDWEFPTRIGLGREEARELLKKIHATIPFKKLGDR